MYILPVPQVKESFKILVDEVVVSFAFVTLRVVAGMQITFGPAVVVVEFLEQLKRKIVLIMEAKIIDFIFLVLRNKINLSNIRIKKLLNYQLFPA